MFVVYMFRSAIVRYSQVENIASKSVTTLLNSLLSGGQVIRALGQKEAFLARGGVLVEELGAANMANFALMRWQSLRLDFVASLLLTLTAFLCSNSSLSPALAGLVISNALTFSSNFSSLANAVSTLMINLAAVARVLALARLPPEEYWPEPGEPLERIPHLARPAPDAALLAALRAPKRSAARKAKYPYAGWDPECWVQRLRTSGWPLQGRIVMDRVAVRYAPHLRAALRRISMTIKGRSSIGVMSRAGGGASTFGLTLLRMIEPDTPPYMASNPAGSSGRIFIDGVDTSILPLAQLRSAFGFVPSEPALFAQMSVAENIDPSGTQSRDSLWSVLEACSLAPAVRALPNGLDTLMSDDGMDLSASHRKLLCFARILIRRPSILVLDDAMTHLDDASDALMQRTVFNLSRHFTVINITHRLRMVMNSDRVLVFDAGDIAEYDVPSALLGITRLEEAPSIHPRRDAIAEFVGRAGHVEETELRALAAAGFILRRFRKRFASRTERATLPVLSASASEICGNTLSEDISLDIADIRVVIVGCVEPVAVTA